MTYKSENYNLLVEDWIPILWADGKPGRVGIRQALTEAGRIRQIAASNPIDNVSLLRLLLAVLQWCKPTPTETDRRKIESNGGIRDYWLEEKLGTINHRSTVFDLLGDGRRFMQALDSAQHHRPVADLFHEFPGATNVIHFRHIKDYYDGACPTCIAIGLARLPTAITGKGSGKHPGINGDPPVYFIPIGKTLTQTLLLNWPFPHVPDDKPCWVNGSFTRAPDAAVGAMEGLTWTSRQFRIDDKSLRSGYCLLCGQRTTVLVTRLYEVNAPNGRMGLSRSKVWRDPHLAYAEEGKNLRAKDTERNASGAAGQWREWLTAVLHTDDRPAKAPAAVIEAARRIGERSLQILAVGLVTRQNDKCLECLESSYSIPTSLLTDDVTNRFADDIRKLDEAVDRTLDPRTTSWTKPVGKLKDAGLLKALAAHDTQKMHALRSALADRLPSLETAMFTAATRNIAGCTNTPLQLLSMMSEWDEVLGGVISAATPGSPLRRREAAERARQALDCELAKLAGAGKLQPRRENNEKQKGRKKKRGRA